MPPETDRYPSVKVKHLIAVCYQLQQLALQEPFYLSARDAAEILECKDPRTALKYLMGLVNDDVLELAEPGTPGGIRAHRYRYKSLLSLTAAAVAKPLKSKPTAKAKVAGASSKHDRESRKALSPYELCLKKDALRDIIASIEKIDKEQRTPEQITNLRAARARLKKVNEQLGALGEGPL
jgi:hypothetical protein